MRRSMRPFHNRRQAVAIPARRRNPHPARRNPQMVVVARIGPDQPVIGRRTDVEGFRDLGPAQARLGHSAHRWLPLFWDWPCLTHSNSTAVTSDQPNRKSSTGMSHGKRRPELCLSL